MKDYKAYNDLYFSRWAPFYDGLELLLSDVRKDVNRQINATNKIVLDVATGTGNLAIDLSESAKQVTGIDLSDQMLDIAKRKRKNSNLTFLKMDTSEMEFGDKEFDIVTIGLGLHDMPPAIRT
jgi:ubiquinone/menaquinone biosynthesis C-methylase UbiE